MTEARALSLVPEAPVEWRWIDGTHAVAEVGRFTVRLQPSMSRQGGWAYTVWLGAKCIEAGSGVGGVEGVQAVAVEAARDVTLAAAQRRLHVPTGGWAR